MTQAEQQRGWNTENRPQNYNKISKTFVIRVPGRGDTESRAKKELKMVEIPINLPKDINLQTQEVEWIINPKKSTSKHITVKLLNTEDRKFLKIVREKWQGEINSNAADFSSETMQVRKKSGITFFKCWKKRTVNSEYPMKISFRNEGEIKTVSWRKTKRMCH